jgi:predicted RNase H-like HicB family nuclease
MKYAIILERTATGFSAYSPDLPGCVSAGDTAEETETNMREAIESHIELMREGGMPVPLPQTRVSYVEVGA